MPDRLPVVAVVGRPNVGKSTLVNRIVGRRETIVEEQPGVTRDRKEVEADWRGRSFLLVDTGGWLASTDALDAQVSRQAERAVAQADVVIFVLDATVGVTEEDDRVAGVLRRAAPGSGRGPRVLVVANKVDSERRELDVWELARLGLGEPLAVSALHGRGSGDMLDAVVDALPAEADPPATGEEDQEPTIPTVAIVGRPNVGKSTLFNRLIGDERSVVHDQPGTTRDTIDTVVETPHGQFRFVDTAGMRRKSRIDEGTEYYSLVRALQAIDRAETALLVIDASAGVTHQDQRLAERVDAAGTAVVIVLNKWDLLDAEARAETTAAVEDRLGFLGYAPVLKVSASSGKGSHKILPALDEAITASRRRVPTRELNQLLQRAQAAQPAPGAKVLYATQGATDPPTFTLFTNRTLPPSYLRYLERRIREHFDFGPTPLKLRVRRRTS
ncbi:MAG: ribosome biogenesis GTPase Der [Actinobacteria bacterium]|nr:ribosome biogenesis GTPase Der [Actinomycetota bacterium]